MDEFERLMLRQGVKPFTNKNGREPSRNVHADGAGTPDKIRLDSPSHVVGETMKPAATPESRGNGELTAWVRGKEAREVFVNALKMFSEEHAQKKQGQITAVRNDGKVTWIDARTSVAEILTRADREKFRVIIIGGEGWTCILHPLMGIATIESDPPDDN